MEGLAEGSRIVGWENSSLQIVHDPLCCPVIEPPQVSPRSSRKLIVQAEISLHLF